MPRVLYNVDDHHAHATLSPSGSVASSDSLVADSACLGSHRCRIYEASQLLTDSRWLGASTLHLELATSDRAAGEAFVAELQAALKPHITARVALAPSAQSVTVTDVRILDTKIDPARLLPLAARLLYVEVEKPRNWRADRAKLPVSHGLGGAQRTSATMATGEAFEAVAAAAASALPPLSSLLVTPPTSPLGASLHCALLQSNGSAASAQLLIDKLTGAIASEVRQQRQIIQAMQRAQEMQADATTSDETNDSHASSATDDSTASSARSARQQSAAATASAALASRVRAQVAHHESRRQQLLAVMRSDVHAIRVVHSCNCCERVLRIEAAADTDDKRSRHSQQTSARAHTRTPEQAASSSPAATSADAVAPLLSPSAALARYASLVSQLRAASGAEHKARRKKLNGKLRDLRDKYAHCVDFNDTDDNNNANATAAASDATSEEARRENNTQATAAAST